MSANERKSWKAVRDIIYARILDGTYSPGERLPFDDVLAEELSCARSTVLRAMQDLSNGGIVERKRKGGTHVKSDPATRATFEIPVTRKEIESKGHIYGYQLVSSEIDQAPLPIAANFNLPKQEDMLHVKALHLADQRPYLYEDRWISTSTVPEIVDIDLSKESANEWLVRNRPYSSCTIRFYAVNAGKSYAPIFGTDETDALFVIERTTWIDIHPITSVKTVASPGYQLVSQVARRETIG